MGEIVNIVDIPICLLIVKHQPELLMGLLLTFKKFGKWSLTHQYELKKYLSRQSDVKNDRHERILTTTVLNKLHSLDNIASRITIRMISNFYHNASKLFEYHHHGKPRFTIETTDTNEPHEILFFNDEGFLSNPQTTFEDVTHPAVISNVKYGLKGLFWVVDGWFCGEDYNYIDLTYNPGIKAVVRSKVRCDSRVCKSFPYIPGMGWTYNTNGYTIIKKENLTLEECIKYNTLRNDLLKKSVNLLKHNELRC